MLFLSYFWCSFDTFIRDRPIRLPELSNRHMFLLWPLGPPVLWHLFLYNTKMWNRDPWGVLVLGWEGWAHGTTPFSPARLFISKKIGPGLVHEPCPKLWRVETSWWRSKDHIYKKIQKLDANLIQNTPNCDRSKINAKASLVLLLKHFCVYCGHLWQLFIHRGISLSTTKDCVLSVFQNIN